MGNYDQKNTSYKGNKPIQQAKKPYQALSEEDYVKRAEEVMIEISKTRMTTTQIRNILAMVNQLYNDVIVTTEAVLSSEVQSQLRYLKVKLVYAAGRNEDVKKFVELSQIAEHLDHVGSSRKQFILYTHYMEALVAYHRFYGGRD